ncbi:MAG: FAD binding domain-containing protein [Ilumatobacteraceae bacterium]
MGVLVPDTLDDAIVALGAQPDALVLAGGTDLMVEINEAHRRLTGTETVVVVGRLPELRTWVHDPGAATVRLGAGITYAEVETGPLAALLPALAQAARTVGSPQIRNVATIGGNLATCSPAGDGLPVLAALDAEVELVGPDGRRTLPVGDFMTGVKRTARRPGELITAVTLPVLDGWQGYAKVGVRNAMVIAIAGACLAVDGPTRSVRIALGSVAPTIVRAPAAEAFAAAEVDWDGAAVSGDVSRRFGELAGQAARPIDDHRASAAYRRRAVEVLAARLLHRAFPAEARGSTVGG